MKRIIGTLFLISTLFIVGCGGSGEKGKNKDKDVPKSTQEKG